jgi:2-polyprenyl-6-methoxyphenol hydroxylase-like FAD-dependent oxidoreductase
MKIIIVGAGISGLAAYLELKKHLLSPSRSGSEEEHEHSYTIYEAYDTSIDTTYEDRAFDESNYSATLVVGGGLGIAPNGLNVLKRLDEEILRDAVREGYMVDTYEMRSRRGGLLMKMHPEASSPSTKNPNGSKKNGTGSMKMLACTRHSIWATLRKRVPDDVIVTRKVSEVVSVTGEDGKTKNIVNFKDGSPSVEADLVIGADGVKSTVRNALFPDNRDQYPPEYE